MRITRSRSVLLLAAIAALALAVAPASAAAFKSTVTIVSGEGSEFRGKVTSPKSRCRAGRRVKLFREDDSGGGDTLAGVALTNRAGIWMMDGSFLAGVYFARVLPAVFHVDGTTVRCAVDISIRQHF